MGPNDFALELASGQGRDSRTGNPAHSCRTFDALYIGTLPPHPGGSAIFNGQLLPALATRGHRVRALAPIEERCMGAADAYAERHPRINVERYAVPFFDSSPDRPVAASYRESEGEQVRQAVTTLIARRRPDLIVAGRETFAWHIPDLAQAHALPCVMLIHGGTLWGILRQTIPPAMGNSLLAQYRKFDLLVAVARHMGTAVAALGLDRAVVIENAIDTDLFAPGPKPEALRRHLQIAEDAIIVAHLSNLKPLKRALDIVASARTVLRRDARIVYVIVGDGLLRSEMEAECRRDGIADRFRFVGWVDRDQVPDYLNLADVVVMPSAIEARALVYLETQACGRVLLASDIPSAREVVADGENGLLFAVGDIEEFSAKTLAAARDPALRREIGRRARSIALSRSLTQMVDEYETALDRLVRRNSGRAVPTPTG